ncbi:hypothetical protein BDC45DRAFT_577398 [Circinella umbellata]|nr:hypothetical protein BDC45DRAFT_577398 [Circinella umbellata]
MVWVHFIEPTTFYGYNGTIIGLAGIVFISTVVGFISIIRHRNYIDRSLQTQIVRLYANIMCADLCMIVSSIIKIAMNKIIDGQVIDGEAILPSYTAIHFFELIYPYSIFNVMLECIRASAYPRIQHIPEGTKRNNQTSMIILLTWFIYLMVFIDVILCIIIGTKKTHTESFESLYSYFKYGLIAVMFWGLFHLTAAIFNNPHDFRDYKLSFITVLILSYIVSIGSIVVAIMSNDLDFDYNITYSIDTIMVKILGLVCLMVVAIGFPTIWWPSISKRCDTPSSTPLQQHTYTTSDIVSMNVPDENELPMYSKIKKNNSDDGSTQQLITGNSEAYNISRNNNNNSSGPVGN